MASPILVLLGSKGLLYLNIPSLVPVPVSTDTLPTAYVYFFYSYFYRCYPLYLFLSRRRDVLFVLWILRKNLWQQLGTITSTVLMNTFYESLLWGPLYFHTWNLVVEFHLIPIWKGRFESRLISKQWFAFFTINHICGFCAEEVLKAALRIAPMWQPIWTGSDQSYLGCRRIEMIGYTHLHGIEPPNQSLGYNRLQHL